MKGRIVLILVLLLIVGGIGGGVYLYIRYNSGSQLIRRAEVALRARNYDSAAELLEQYRRQEPGDWRGPFLLARARIGQGRYGDARQLLHPLLADPNAYSPAANAVRCRLLLADSYVDKPLADLSAPGPKDIETLQEAAESFAKALEARGDVRSRGADGSRQLREAMGIYRMQLTLQYGRLAERLGDEANKADLAGQETIKRAHLRQKAMYEQRERDAYREGIETLMGLLREDPSRSRAAQALTDVALSMEDEETLGKLRDLLSQADRPAPETTARLIVREMPTGPLEEMDPAEREKIRNGARLVDGLVEAHPNLPNVLLARAHLAILLEDFEMAGTLVQRVLSANSAHMRARLLHAKLLRREAELARAKGDADRADKTLAEAGRILQSLRNAARTPEVLYEAGQAAWLQGRRESAMQAWREAIEASDGTYAPALLEYARRVLDDAPEEARDNASRLYEQRKDSPEALQLLVTASLRSRPESLPPLLEEVLSREPLSARMLMIVSAAYRAMGEAEQAETIASRLADADAVGPTDQLARARGLTWTGRIVEAEELLRSLCRDKPDYAPAWFELGRMYEETRRTFQARNAYQRAVALEPTHDPYHLAMARVLGKLEQYGEALEHLDEITDAGFETNLLRMQLRERMGQPLTPQEKLALVSRDGGNLAAAMAMLAQGNYDLAIEACRKAQASYPRSADVQHMLGTAYFARGGAGDVDSGVEAYRRVIELDPDRLMTYYDLALRLSRDRGIDEAVETLGDIPGAIDAYVRLAKAFSLVRTRRLGEAMTLYREISNDPTAQIGARLRADVLLVGLAQGAGGPAAGLREIERVLKRLDGIQEDEGEAFASLRARLMMYRAGALAQAGRRVDALESLDAAARLSEQVGGTARTRQIALLYAQLREPKRALELCEGLIERMPSSPAPYLARARVHRLAGEMDAALADVRKAVSLQPDNYRYQLNLARVLEHLGKRREALAALEAMAERGEVATMVAQWEQAEMLARWGLQELASQRMERYAEREWADTPELRLRLGKALVMMGNEDRARSELAQILPADRQYAEAQRVVASTYTGQRRLAVLDELAQHRPDSARVLAWRMTAWMDANDPARAVALYDEYVQANPDETLGEDIASIVLTAMTRAGLDDRALALAAGRARASDRPLWARRAIALAMPDRLETVGDLVGQPNNVNDPGGLLLGLASASVRGDGEEIRLWLSQLDDLHRRGLAAGQAGLSPPTRFLGYCLAGRLDRAQGLIEQFEPGEAFSPTVARSLLTGRSEAEVAALARSIVRSFVALGSGMRTLGRRVALATLNESPDCLWPIALASRTAVDAETAETMLETVRHEPCPLLLRLRAMLQQERGEHDQAVATLRQARKDVDSPSLGRQLAGALEAAGNLPEALELYLQFARDGNSPIAANNAAYLTARLYPNDDARLEHAEELIRQAIAESSVPQFHDTLGWILHLRGRDELAKRPLVTALLAVPGSAEVHYHLGKVHAATGEGDLARWHLQAAITYADKALQRGEGPADLMREVISSSKAALSELAPARSASAAD